MLLLSAGCVATGPYARSGALGGGLAGGAIGALAGAPSDRSVEGAAIGAVAGSVLGNLTGDLADQDAAWASAEQQSWSQQVRSRAVTVDQLLEMQRNGVTDQLMINHIHNNGVISPLRPNDLIALKQGGVSDHVIATWQQTPPAGVASPASAPPIFVQPVYEPDCVYLPPHPVRRYRRRHWH